MSEEEYRRCATPSVRRDGQGYWSRPLPKRVEWPPCSEVWYVLRAAGMDAISEGVPDDGLILSLDGRVLDGDPSNVEPASKHVWLHIGMFLAGAGLYEREKP